MIFLSITGSWTAALLYDRREKKKAQAKWCKLVSHLSEEELPPNGLPRKVTVFLTSPPGDGLRSAREHFVEYVKPVLVAAAMDWDVIEGRREGEVRAGLAERIRRQRRRQGESAEAELEFDKIEALTVARQSNGVQAYEGVRGDIVVGRNTWKEYIRGLHEGWLGPMDAPKTVPEIPNLQEAQNQRSADVSVTIPEPAAIPAAVSSPTATVDDASPTATLPSETTSATTKPVEEEKKEEEPKKPAKKPMPPPFINTDAYANATLSSSTPPEFPPSIPISFPHILGFFNTPIRMYRFLQQRKVADNIGRQTAALVLAAHRPYQQGRSESNETEEIWEQEAVLLREEKEWHKSARQRTDNDDRERVWLDDMVLDRRVASRMSRFELDPAEEARAGRIGRSMAGIPGKTVPESDGRDESKL